MMAQRYTTHPPALPASGKGAPTTSCKQPKSPMPMIPRSAGLAARAAYWLHRRVTGPALMCKGWTCARNARSCQGASGLQRQTRL